VRRGVIAVAAIAAIGISAEPGKAAVVFADAAGSRPARIHRRWISHLALPLPSATIVVAVASCPDVPYADGCSAPGVIWLDPNADQAVLLHELGHQFDYTQPAWARAAFEALNHDRRPWGADPNGPFEQFAEAWMGCALPALAADRYDTATSRYDFAFGYSPSFRGLQGACKLVRIAARAIVAAQARARHTVPGAVARRTSPT
jgi:hypothetical protein